MITNIGKASAPRCCNSVKYYLLLLLVLSISLQQRNYVLADEDEEDEGEVMKKGTTDLQAKRRYRRRGILRRKDTSVASLLFPGVAPEEYASDDLIPMWVELVESKKTQVPFDYYDLPVCPGPSVGALQRMRKNLGAKLQGYNMKPSPYAIRTLNDIGCTAVCMVKITPKKLRWLRKLVERQYRVHVSLDGLPVLMRSKDLNYAVRGYPVGFKAPPSFTGLKQDEYYLYNHLRFTISYNKDPSFEGSRIVGFDVHPVSILHEFDDEVKSDSKLETCDPEKGEKVINDPSSYLALRMADDETPVKNTLDVVYSYEVEWVKSALAWSDRWDIYLVGSPDDEVHYFAIVNSLMIVIFLSGSIATVLLRTLRKDITAYNELANSIEDAEEAQTGWKLVHGDVFRPPKDYALFLSVAVGTGAQLGMAVSLTILLALLRVINFMNKGQALTTIIVLYVLSGSVAGYTSSRLYKFFEAQSWKQNTVITAAAFPGLLVVMFICLDVFLALAGAATAVSIWTIIALFLLWLCVSTPLVFVGSYFGFRAPKIEVPTKTNQISRFIPDAPWHCKLPYSMVLGGILPFGSVCIEMFFILGALWLHQIYYVVGFLLLVIIILVISCAEVGIMMCYMQLSAEDHQWWWRSFLNTASAGGYLFLYCLWFLSTKLDLVGFLPILVYLTYMSMLSLAFALFCGSVGFLSCFTFNKMIYGALKVD